MSTEITACKEKLLLESQLNDANLILNNLQSELNTLFSFSDIIPNIGFNSGAFKVLYASNRDILDASTSEINFTFSIKNNQLDIIHNMSFFNVNSEKRNSSTISLFSNLLSDCLMHVNSIEHLLLDKVSILKENQTLIPKLEKKIQQLDIEIQEIDLKDDIHKIQSVLAPINNFCVYSFLCNQYNIPFENKPTKSDIALLTDTLFNLNNQRNYFSKNFSFHTLSIEGGSYSFEETRLNVSIQDSDSPLKMQMNKLKSIKAVNAELSKQITFKGNLVENKFQFSNIINTCKYYGSIKDLHNYLKPHIIENTLNKF